MGERREREVGRATKLPAHGWNCAIFSTNRFGDPCTRLTSPNRTAYLRHTAVRRYTVIWHAAVIRDRAWTRGLRSIARASQFGRDPRYPYVRRCLTTCIGCPTRPPENVCAACSARRFGQCSDDSRSLGLAYGCTGGQAYNHRAAIRGMAGGPEAHQYERTQHTR